MTCAACITSAVVWGLFVVCIIASWIRDQKWADGIDWAREGYPETPELRGERKEDLVKRHTWVALTAVSHRTNMTYVRSFYCLFITIFTAIVVAGLRWSNSKDTAGNSWSSSDFGECMAAAAIAAVCSILLTLFASHLFWALPRTAPTVVDVVILRTAFALILVIGIAGSIISIIRTTSYSSTRQRIRIPVVIFCTLLIHFIIDFIRLLVSYCCYSDSHVEAEDAPQFQFHSERDLESGQQVSNINQKNEAEVTITRGSFYEPIGLQSDQLVLTDVAADSPAENCGLQEYIGWTIIEVNDLPVHSLSQMRSAMNSKDVKLKLAIGTGEPPMLKLYNHNTNVPTNIPAAPSKIEGKSVPLVTIRGMVTPQNGTRARLIEMGGEDPGEEEMVVVELVETGRRITLRPRNLLMADQSDGPDVVASNSAPVNLRGASGQINAIDGNHIVVQFPNPISFERLTPSQLIMSPEKQQIRDQISNSMQTLPIIGKFRTIDHRRNKLHEIISNLSIPDKMDGDFKVTGLPIPIEKPKPRPVLPVPAVAPVESVNLSMSQFRSLLSQFYFKNKPSLMKEVDNIVSMAYGKPDAPRELLSRLELKYPEQTRIGELLWLHDYNNSVIAGSITDPPRNLYVQFGELDYMFSQYKNIPLSLQKGDMAEGLPVWSNGELQLTSYKSRWVISDDSTILMSSSEPHSYGVALGTLPIPPQAVISWKLDNGIEPSVSVTDFPIIKERRTGGSVGHLGDFMSPNRSDRVHKPVTTITNPLAITYLTPIAIPGQGGERVKITVQNEGESERCLLFEVGGGTPLQRNFKTTQRIALNRDKHGVAVYATDLGEMSKVYLPSSPESQLRDISQLCKQAGVLQDINQEYKSLMSQAPSAIDKESDHPDEQVRGLIDAVGDAIEDRSHSSNSNPFLPPLPLPESIIPTENDKIDIPPVRRRGSKHSSLSSSNRFPVDPTRLRPRSVSSLSNRSHRSNNAASIGSRRPSRKSIDSRVNSVGGEVVEDVLSDIPQPPEVPFKVPKTLPS